MYAKFTMLGRICKLSEIKKVNVANGTADVMTLTLAQSDTYDSNPSYFNITFWDKGIKYFEKRKQGDTIIVDGKIKQGKKNDQYYLEFVGDSVNLIKSANKDNNNG